VFTTPNTKPNGIGALPTLEEGRTMSDQATIDAIENGELILMVDSARPAGDLFKLPASLLAVTSTRVSDAKAKNAAVAMTDAATVGASAQRQQALDKLADLLRNGYNAIGAIASDDITDAQRAQVYAAYGWEGGLIGDLSGASRIEELGNLAVTVATDATVPAIGKYSATLVTRITNWLAIYDATSLLATGGDRQTLIQARNDARDLLASANSRVRHFYCSASDDGESTPELAKIGMQPKRASGDAQPQPLPDAPGAASFDATTRQLTIPALPGHATFIRAFRQPAGGKAESAGVSNSTSVSVVGITPLTPGVTYTFWVVGENSRGQGPESNHVTFTA
jgi:hypothetical protein